MLFDRVALFLKNELRGMGDAGISVQIVQLFAPVQQAAIHIAQQAAFRVGQGRQSGRPLLFLGVPFPLLPLYRESGIQPVAEALFNRLKLLLFCGEFFNAPDKGGQVRFTDSASSVFAVTGASVGTTSKRLCCFWGSGLGRAALRGFLGGNGLSLKQSSGSFSASWRSSSICCAVTSNSVI